MRAEIQTVNTHTTHRHIMRTASALCIKGNKETGLYVKGVSVLIEPRERVLVNSRICGREDR